MPVPNSFDDIHTDPAENSPPGTESAKGVVDDYLRTAFAFIKQNHNALAELDTEKAASGANSDITSLSGLTTALSIAQGGTGAKTADAALDSLGATTTGTALFTAADAAAARAAIGAVTAGEALPSGAIAHFARTTAPSGWLKANGAAVSRTTYAALFAAIGTAFGAGNGSTTFNLPDLRGEFLRGWDEGRGLDSGRSFGSAQGHALQNHAHWTGVSSLMSQNLNTRNAYIWQGHHAHSSFGATHRAGGEASTGVSDARAGITSAPVQSGASLGYARSDEGHINTSASVAHETRPRNVALLACIKT